MDASELSQGQYASFLVRLWRSSKPDAGGLGDEWQGEIEHIQSGRQWIIAVFGDLSVFQGHLVAEPEAPPNQCQSLSTLHVSSVRGE